MPQRPSRVIRSSELKAARGKSRTSLRGEIDDLRARLTKTDEEARRKQGFYDPVSFYKGVYVDDGTIFQVGGVINMSSILPYIIVSQDMSFSNNDLLIGAAAKIRFSGFGTFNGLPTTSVGLDSGDAWNDAGTVKIKP